MYWYRVGFVFMFMFVLVFAFGILAFDRLVFDVRCLRLTLGVILYYILYYYILLYIHILIILYYYTYYTLLIPFLFSSFPPVLSSFFLSVLLPLLSSHHSRLPLQSLPSPILFSILLPLIYFLPLQSSPVLSHLLFFCSSFFPYSFPSFPEYLSVLT